MGKLRTLIPTLIIAACFYSGSAAAHCEIPCGIYDDRMRMEMISEHIETVEKSILQITELAEAKNKNYNQLVRWIDNKEHHATEIQHIVSRYFLTQRIKFDDKQYDQKLEALHRILVYAMKCKQSLDLGNIEKLRMVTREFEKLYFGDK